MKFKRWHMITLTTLVIFLVIFYALFQIAAKLLKNQIQEALGPESEIRAIHVGLTGVIIDDIRIKAPLQRVTQERWPSSDQLRAQRIVVVPDVIGLLSANVRIRSITIDQAYLCILRERNGTLKILPSLLASKTGKKETISKKEKPLEILINHIKLNNSSVDFFDASVRQPAHQLQLQNLQAALDNLLLPNLNSPLKLKITGNLKGVRHHGTLNINGTTNLASHDSQLSTTLRQIDLIAFQPYFIKASETGVRSGLLDLQLDTRIKNNRLNAPGKITLSQFELQPGKNSSTFAGVPLQLVLGSMKDHRQQINLKFTLEGNLNDPNFSLNENFATRIAAGLGGALGLSVEDIARGTGNLGKKTIDVAGEAGNEVGHRLKNLFGK